ncbi:hypothetical protein HJ01_02824 [Flavobacterium frigoris PS1]|uniref:Transposase n=1 Tax=Flavobacterium frigoris (strain PS1) TaxID=1086011 RepID=H7FUK9_FLAFP|nr:hypothetical protein HJ01_02824 [Flavobacterium frigoris PS1]
MCKFSELPFEKQKSFLKISCQLIDEKMMKWNRKKHFIYQKNVNRVLLINH